MRVLVVGCNGQLARTLATAGAGWRGLELVRLGRPQLDLQVAGSAASAVRRVRPDVIVNAAAYTAVEQAEAEPERALRVNATGAGELAEAAREIGAKIIQISTDYVFDGASREPYRPDAAPNPINSYGRSKLAGEERVRAATPNHLILRTAWLFSACPGNFVSSMLMLARDRPMVRVVADQWGSPTSATDLAIALRAILSDWRDGGARGLGSIQHFAGTGVASWADLAEASFGESAAMGGPTAKVVPIPSHEWPDRTRRPERSALDSTAFASNFGFQPRPWREALRSVISRLVGGRPEDVADVDHFSPGER